MKRCVNKNAIIYKSNQSVNGKDFLYSTQGEQVYQSAVKVNVDVQVVGSLNCGKYVVEAEEDLKNAVQVIPKYQIGATLDESAPRTGTKSLCSYIVPVDDRLQAIKVANLTSEIADGLRHTIDSTEGTKPISPTTGIEMTIADIRESKQKISTFNQKVKQKTEITLTSKGLHKGDADYAMAYGKFMGVNRIQFSNYSIRLKFTVRHNIFNEYSIGNLSDDAESYDYRKAKAKRYSDARSYVVDVPVTTINQFDKLMNLIKKYIDDLCTFDIYNGRTSAEVIELITADERTSEQIAHDEQLSIVLGLNEPEESLEELSQDNEINSILLNIALNATNSLNGNANPHPRGRASKKEKRSDE